MKKWFFVFVFAFLLNLVWENLHSYLYVHYKSGEITELILIKAALFDGLVILGLIYLFYLIPRLSEHPWLIIVFGVLISLAIEYWALVSGRWAYNEMMPIVPVLRTGLTPTVQLGLLGYLSYKFSKLNFLR